MPCAKQGGNLHKRNAICHEIAHTFFFNTSRKYPVRKDNSYPDKREEHLCFWAAREMLVPTSLCKNELNSFGNEALYTLDGILKFSKKFQVSLDIIAYRLTHDLSLLGSDWIILWYFNKKRGKLLPRSLYPKHVSNAITQYMKNNIIDSLKKNIFHFDNKDNHEEELIVGKLKKIRLKTKTKKIVDERLNAISWISPYPS